MNQTKSNSGMDAIAFIKLMVKWKKQLLLVFFISLLGSYLLSFLITPLYKSTTVVYPFNLDNYSKESSTEQMVQLFKSEDVREHLIHDFDLYNHYDIDSTGNSPRFEIMKKLDKNITINKTEYESVEISILDKDPHIAARMCDSIIVYMDRKALGLMREKAAENLVVMNRRLDEKKAEMDSMVMQLTHLSTEYGVLDYESQVLGFAREYYRTMAQSGNTSRMESAKRNLEAKGTLAFSLQENLWRVRGQYNDLKKLAEDLEADYTKEISFHNLVTKAVPAEKRDSPRRSLLALLVTAAVMAISILVIIYQEYYREKFDAGLSNA